jgi:chromosome partitioning protein
MARWIAVTNQKGGVGKTTTAVNLAATLGAEGQRVLVVDVDPQGNATSGLGLDKARLDRCIYDVFVGKAQAEEVICPTELPQVHLLPATLNLAGAEIELVSALSRETRLKKALEPVADGYDFMVLDCPPSLGILTMNALAAAREVLVPIQCEFYALEGITQLRSVIELVKAHLNPSLDIGGVLMTMYDPRLNLCEQVVEEVRKHFGPRVYKTMIPRNVKLAEAPSFGKSIEQYDPRSRGAVAYRELAKEVIHEEARSGTRSFRIHIG